MKVRGLSLNCKDKRTAVVIQAAGQPLHLQQRPVLAELKSIYCLPQGAPPPVRQCSSGLRLHAELKSSSGSWKLSGLNPVFRLRPLTCCRADRHENSKRLLRQASQMQSLVMARPPTPCRTLRWKSFLEGLAAATSAYLWALGLVAGRSQGTVPPMATVAALH